MNKPVKASTVTVSLPSSTVADLERRVRSGEFRTLDEAVAGALLELEHRRSVELAGGDAAFAALVDEVTAHPDAQVEHGDAFEALGALREKYRLLAEAQESDA
jgi:Arc/MetJ-type ribon-helix-helix transcriptional regulator